MGNSDLEAQRKSSLLDCTWLENEYGFETLKFLMHFREPGSSLYLFVYHTYSYFFLFSFCQMVRSRQPTGVLIPVV
jgi:hypothetical protein